MTVQVKQIEKINVGSSQPVYLQIERQVEVAISAGRLDSGDRLPSVKELSDQLGVNPKIVATAYRHLEKMGLIFTRRGIGVFIKEGVRANTQKRVNSRLTLASQELVSDALAAGLQVQDIRMMFERALVTKGLLKGAVRALLEKRGTLSVESEPESKYKPVVCEFRLEEGVLSADVIAIVNALTRAATQAGGRVDFGYDTEPSAAKTGIVEERSP